MNTFRRSLLLKFIGIVSILIIGLLVTRSIFGPDAELRKLAADFKAANQAPTIDPMLDLYSLEGIDELSIIRLRAALRYELGLPIKAIDFEPLSDASKAKIQFVRSDATYGPVLEPLHTMRVNYNSKDNFSSIYTVGKTASGNWKLILTKPAAN